MMWLLVLALLVFSVFLLVTGQLFLGLFVFVVFVISLVRCILWTICDAIWRLIRKPVIILLVIALFVMAVTAIPILLAVKSQPEAECDYLIVLGAGVDGDTPSPILQERINAAYAYLVTHPETICIATGGQGEDENISEAQCIFDHLTARGIAPARIWIEDQSTSTAENFQYSTALLKEKTGGIPEKLGVLSSEFHLFRASLMAKENGLDPIYIAAPTSELLVQLDYTVREIIALWKNLIIGG